MDRETLEQLLARGTSLAEIRRHCAMHESSVAHWVEKHGLRAAKRAKHAPRGALDRERLVDLVDAGMTIAEIALAVDRSAASVRHWLKRYSLRTANRRGRRPRDGSAEARREGARLAVLRCPEHGLTDHVRETRGYYRCKRCRQEAVIRRRRRVKAAIVAERGGRCVLCGYDRCTAALEFHHLDPSSKAFGLAQQGHARSIERVRAEMRKCVLVCSNCHAEVESGFSSIPASALHDPG
jgi:Homeodomain-like domain